MPGPIDPIRILPAGGPEVASARLRAISLAQALSAAGTAAVVGGTGPSRILLVQKRIRRADLAQAVAAARRGDAVVWDADDVGPALDFWALPRRRARLLPFTAGSTTDTAGHAEELAALCGGRPPEIIPDMVDYDPPGPQLPAQLAERPLRILWFGSFSNIALLEQWLPAVSALPDVELVVCTRSPPEAQLWSRWPMLRHVPWNAETFVDVLRSCHLSLLMHDGAAADRGKSNNRQITSICWGVPALVSCTPAYAETAGLCGVPESVCDGPGGLAPAIERLRSARARCAYLERAQPAVWQRWSPAAVAQAAIRAYEQILSAPAPQRPTLLDLLSTRLP